MATAAPIQTPFSVDQYRIVHPPYVEDGTIFHNMHAYDPTGGFLAFVKHGSSSDGQYQIRIYADEDASHELLCAKVREWKKSIVGNTFDIDDSVTREKLGAIRHCMARSLVRDEWQTLDGGGRDLGSISEGWVRGILRRRLVPAPASYRIRAGGQTIGTLRHNFNPMHPSLDVDVSKDRDCRMDRRLALACAIVVMTYCSLHRTGHGLFEV